MRESSRLFVWGASGSITAKDRPGESIVRWGETMGGTKLDAYFAGVELRTGSFQFGGSLRYTLADGPKASLQEQGVGSLSLTHWSAKGSYVQVSTYNDLFIPRFKLPHNWGVNRDEGDTAGGQIRFGNLNQGQGLTDVAVGMEMATGIPDQSSIMPSSQNPKGQYTVVKFSEVSRGDLYLKLGFQWGGVHLDAWAGVNSRAALYFTQTEVVHRKLVGSPDLPRTTGTDFFGGLSLSFTLADMKIRNLRKN